MRFTVGYRWNWRKLVYPVVLAALLGVVYPGVAPDIQIVKNGMLNLGMNGTLEAGDTIEYTFEVTAGTFLDTVTVTDNMVATIDCNGGGNQIPPLDPGESETCTGTYVITQADIDAGVKNNTATAEAQIVDTPNFASDTDDHSQPLAQTLAIEIVKDGTLDLGGNGTLEAGDMIDYTFEVTNTGNVTLTSIAVSDDVVASISCMSGNPIPTLAPGASDSCTGSYAVTQDDIDAGGVVNTATAQGDAPDESMVSDTDMHNEPLARNPAIEIVKDGTLDLGGNGTLEAGDMIDYTFEVTNTGNVTLTSIAVSDDVVASISCMSGNPIPTLAPGASDSCTGSYAVTQDDIDVGGVVNTATAQGDAPDESMVSDTDMHNEPLARNPAIEIVKDGTLDLGGNGTLEAGDMIDYTFEVTNTGNVTLFSIAVSDDVVASISCMSGNPIPSLAPGASDSCTGSYAVTQDDIDAGAVVNTATAQGDAPDESMVSDTDMHNEPLAQNPAIEIVKDGTLDLGGNGTLEAGDMIDYTFEVTNTGNVTLTSIAVSDDVVASISCMSGNPIPSLAPGASETCMGSYAVTQDDIDAGAVANTATAQGDAPDESMVSDTDMHNEPLAQRPAIEIVKDGALDLGGNGTLDVGDMINYTFEVTNTGNVTLSNSAVSDNMVATIMCPNGNPIPTLAPGASETCMGSYAVTQGDIDAGEKVNTAMVVADLPQEGTVDDSDMHVEPLEVAPAIQIVKDGDLDLGVNGILEPGDLINYTFEVTNTGNVTLSNASVTDNMVATIMCPSGNPIPTLAPGASETCEGSYAVTQGDIDAEEKVNTAMVQANPPLEGSVSDSDDHIQPLDPALTGMNPASIMAVPTLGEWGLLAMCIGLAAVGVTRLRG